MALSQQARRVLSFGMESMPVGKEIADVIDAGSGSLSTYAKNHLRSQLRNPTAATEIAASINAGTALTGRNQDLLGQAICNRVVAQEIAAALAL